MGYYSCDYCYEGFYWQHELEDHFEEDHYYCRSCGRFFKSAHGLHEHYRQSPKHDYCGECRRHFQNTNNLQSHLNSSVHRPQNVMCPFRGCGKGFVSASALILHLEAGTCCSGVDRKTVNKFVRQLDKKNVITDPTRLLTCGDSDFEYQASTAAWNGCMYECYLCHGEFSSLRALNQHLASPRHQSKIYICPLSSCRIRFGTLSGLCQHVESERCGVSKFRQVKDVMDTVVGGMSRITL